MGTSTISSVGSNVGLWILVVVFGLSSLSKLRSLDSSALATVDFGITHRPSRGLILSVALVEAALAMGLAAGAVVKPVALISTALLLVFAFLILRALREGTSVSCHCFGPYSGTLSYWTLGRTMGLAGLGVLVAAVDGGYPSVAQEALAGCTAAGVVGLAALGSTALGLTDRMWVTR